MLVRCEVFAAKVNGLLAGIASFEAEMMDLRVTKNLVTKNVHLMYNLFLAYLNARSGTSSSHQEVTERTSWVFDLRNSSQRWLASKGKS